MNNILVKQKIYELPNGEAFTIIEYGDMYEFSFLGDASIISAPIPVLIDWGFYHYYDKNNNIRYFYLTPERFINQKTNKYPGVYADFVKNEENYDYEKLENDVRALSEERKKELIQLVNSTASDPGFYVFLKAEGQQVNITRMNVDLFLNIHLNYANWYWTKNNVLGYWVSSFTDADMYFYCEHYFNKYGCYPDFLDKNPISGFDIAKKANMQMVKVLKIK